MLFLFIGFTNHQIKLEMTITFENSNKESITHEQAISSGDYTKVYSDSGVIKKREIYRQGILMYIDYYKTSEESEASIVNMLSHLVPFTIFETEIIANKKVEIEKSFTGTNLKIKQRSLYDENNYLICEENYDISEDLPIYNRTRKYHYDTALDDLFPIMTAYYNADGSLNRIEYDTYRSDQDALRFYSDGTSGVDDMKTLAKVLNITMSEMNYYLSAALKP